MEDAITRLFLSTEESILACKDRNQQIKSIQDFIVSVKFLSCKDVSAATISKGVINSCRLIISTINDLNDSDCNKHMIEISDEGEKEDLLTSDYEDMDEEQKAVREESDRKWSEAGNFEFPKDVKVGNRTVKFEEEYDDEKW